MANRKQLIRLLAITEKLRNSKEASFDEISDYLERKSEITGDDLNITLRTFQRDIKDIYSIFDVEIKCNSYHKYYIQYDGADEMQPRMFEAFDILHALKITNDLSLYIHPEKHGGGTENIYGFIHAIKKQIVIKITHKKFWDAEPNKRNVEPYGLKEFRGRWYLIAKDKNSNTIKTFGLDRIHDIELTKEKFALPEDFNVKTLFKSCFGIVMPEKNEKPEKIILSFSPLKGNFIKSLPLHESQQVIIDNEKECRVQLFIYITHDFVRELLAHSEELKVISPKSLKNKLNQIYKSALNTEK